MNRILSVLIVLLSLIPSLSYADRAGEARAHYQKATAHYAIGEFKEAAVEYQAAYKLKQDPALLFNAAQSLRLANDPEKALILYRNYLNLYPNESNVADVRAQIDKLKEAIAAADKAKNEPPTGTTEPTQISTDQKVQPDLTPKRETLSAQVAIGTGSSPPSTPVYKKWWLWTLVGVVAAGGAVTAAVLATQPRGNWSNLPDVGPGAHASATAVRW